MKALKGRFKVAVGDLLVVTPQEKFHGVNEFFNRGVFLVTDVDKETSTVEAVNVTRPDDRQNPKKPKHYQGGEKSLTDQFILDSEALKRVAPAKAADAPITIFKDYQTGLQAMRFLKDSFSATGSEKWSFGLLQHEMDQELIRKLKYNAKLLFNVEPAKRHEVAAKLAGWAYNPEATVESGQAVEVQGDAGPRLATD
jgi:putative AlgH/UPF0301 family transcriptional regulator